MCAKRCQRGWSEPPRTALQLLSARALAVGRVLPDRADGDEGIAIFVSHRSAQGGVVPRPEILAGAGDAMTGGSAVREPFWRNPREFPVRLQEFPVKSKKFRVIVAMIWIKLLI